VKKSKAAKAAWQSRKTGEARRATMGEAVLMAPGTNRVVIGLRPQRGVAADGKSKEEEMADEEEGQATWQASDIMMT